MFLDAAQHFTFSARLDCHYLLYAPERPQTLMVALHGFGQDAETMLRLAGKLLGPEHAIASVQAPSQFYRGQNGEVGYCWITRRYPESAIRLHHDMLRYVLREAGARCHVPPKRRVLIGFSQPVGLNYRFAATHPAAVRGVIGICGGLPGNWDDGPYRPVSAALLHIARHEDEFYPAELTMGFADRLRLRAHDVEFHMLEGGHRFPSKAKPLVDQWLARILG